MRVVVLTSLPVRPCLFRLVDLAMPMVWCSEQVHDCDNVVHQPVAWLSNKVRLGHNFIRLTYYLGLLASVDQSITLIVLGTDRGPTDCQI